MPALSELSSDGGAEDNEIIDSSDTQYAPASELTSLQRFPHKAFRDVLYGASMPGAGAPQFMACSSSATSSPGQCLFQAFV